jgi:hypothetical protein
MRVALQRGLMNHLYAIQSEQQPMLLPILELESDPCATTFLSFAAIDVQCWFHVFRVVSISRTLDALLHWYHWCC